MVMMPSSTAASLICDIRRSWSSDEVQDALHEQGACDQRVASLAAADQRVLSKANNPQDDQETEYIVEDSQLVRETEVRQIAMWMLGSLVNYARLPETHLLKAGLLLDVFCLRQAQVLSESSIAAVVVALVSIVTKFDTSENIAPQRTLIAHTQYLIGILRDSGCPRTYGDVSPAKVLAQEQDILSALHWSVDLPTVEDWVGLVCARLNVFMFRMLAPLLVPMQERSFFSARILAVNCTSTAEFSPRHVAQGLLCLNLVSARVLPADAFALGAELASPLWDLKTGKGGHKSAFNPRSVELLLECLEKATGSDQASLKKDAHLVNEALLRLQKASAVA
jgi:hypothetical protein